MSSLAEVYSIPTSGQYPDFLRALYSINKKLNAEGVLAPGNDSVKNMKLLYSAIGCPLDSIATIHVGGTNGKGSTAYKISKCLTASGLRTGLFVSPHLSSYRERAQVDGTLISEQETVAHLTTIFRLCASQNIPATEFEISFLLATLHFHASQCDAVVLEVGCGGRYDATNVVSTALSIICSVSLDHTRILGNTVEAIAHNKAGIFKPGVPALAGPGVPLSVLQQVADEVHCPLHPFDSLWTQAAVEAEAAGFVGEVADTDDLNARISFLALYLLHREHRSFRALCLADPLVVAALRQRPPCRWQVEHVRVAGHTVEVVLDVGHNPAAVQALVRRLQRDYSGRNVHMVYAMSRDKDVRVCLREIAQAVPASHIHFAQSKNWRAVAVAGLEQMFREETGQQLGHVDDGSAEETVRRVLHLAAQQAENSVVVICGTGFIMPPARGILGIVEPRDDVDLLR